MPEATTPDPERDFTQDALLTEAYHNSNVVFYEADSGNKDSLFPIAFAKEHQDLKGHQVVVIKRTIDKNKVAVLLALLLIISPTLGLVVGLCSHNAELGIAVSAGVFALASFIQGLAAWVQG
ncbi:hypothetical protein OEA41_000155 [Lepraria neglecta]|uniref:Uncharacterized protein n=1 Tax=Lepraria neglecta TaxID=209136 RepID=A0AAD9ZG39_9LECA|nr:hypothetical protein OEA41_000155 [Lepraria neglecta]